MAPLSCTRCNLNFRTKALLTAHNRTKRHREKADDEEAETDEEVEEGAEGHEEEEETQEEETESSEEEDEEEEPRPKKKRRIEKRKSSKKKKRPSKKNRGHKRRRRSSPSSSDSSSNSSSSSSDSSESESSSESSDEGGLLDRNEVIRKLIPRSWPKKKTGLDAAFAAAEEEIREAGAPAWVLRVAKSYHSIGSHIFKANKESLKKKKKPHPAAEAVFVNFTKFYLRAVFTEKAERRFRAELEKLKDTTSVRELRKALAKARSEGEAPAHRQGFRRGGAGSGGGGNFRQTNFNRNRQNTDKTTEKKNETALISTAAPQGDKENDKRQIFGTTKTSKSFQGVRAVNKNQKMGKGEAAVGVRGEFKQVESINEGHVFSTPSLRPEVNRQDGLEREKWTPNTRTTENLYDAFQESTEEEGETIVLQADQKEGSGDKTPSVEETDARDCESLPTTYREPPPHSACEEYCRGLGGTNATAQNSRIHRRRSLYNSHDRSIRFNKEIRVQIEEVRKTFYPGEHEGIAEMDAVGQHQVPFSAPRGEYPNVCSRSPATEDPGFDATHDRCSPLELRSRKVARRNLKKVPTTALFASDYDYVNLKVEVNLLGENKKDTKSNKKPREHSPLQGTEGWKIYTPRMKPLDLSWTEGISELEKAMSWLKDRHRYINLLRSCPKKQRARFHTNSSCWMQISLSALSTQNRYSSGVKCFH
jgi:hypothetical protein